MTGNRPSGPLWVTLNVTGVCNLSCEYCFFQPRKHEHMPLASVRKVIATLQAQQLFFLTISGGEPFVHPQINEILEHAHDVFEHTTVLSNGSAIRKRHLDCIKGIINAKGSFPMQVSLDAVDADTNDKTRGMTDRVKANLSKLSELGVSLTIAIVVSSQNIDQVVRTIIGSKHLTRHFHIMPFKPVPFLEQADGYLHAEATDMSAIWERLRDVRNEHDLQIRLPSDECSAAAYSATGAPCVAGFTQVVIDPDLDVRACSRCTHSIVGNLEDESMESIWDGPKLARIYQRDVPYCQVPSEWKAAINDPAFSRGKRGAIGGRQQARRDGNSSSDGL